MASITINTDIKIDLPTFLGSVGIFFSILGVFLPFVVIPIFGSVNYFLNGKGDGIVILALSVMSIPALIKREKILLIFPSICAIMLLVFGYIIIIKNVPEESANFISIGIGWIMMLFGSISILVSSFLIKGENYDKSTPLFVFLISVFISLIGLVGDFVNNLPYSSQVTFLHFTTSFGEGIVVLLLLVVAYFLVVFRKTNWLWTIPIPMIALLAYVLFFYKVYRREIYNDVGWAAVALFLGPIILFVSGILLSKQRREEISVENSSQIIANNEIV